MSDSGGWKPDPTRRHELRYWDGTGWTVHVSDAGATSTDDGAPGAPPPPAPAAPAAPVPTFAPAPPATQAPVFVPGAAPSGKKIPAGICGILIGAFGVHKFVLGYTAEGLIMLLVSIIVGIFTCGIATGVMGVIGLIEGIIYLTKSDQEFDQTYVYNKRGWF